MSANPQSLRERGYEVYDAFVDAADASRKADNDADQRRGSYDDAQAAFTAMLEARSALHAFIATLPSDQPGVDG